MSLLLQEINPAIAACDYKIASDFDWDCLAHSHPDPPTLAALEKGKEPPPKKKNKAKAFLLDEPSKSLKKQGTQQSKERTDSSISMDTHSSSPLSSVCFMTHCKDKAREASPVQTCSMSCACRAEPKKNSIKTWNSQNQKALDTVNV